MINPVRSAGRLEAKKLAVANTLQELILKLFEILESTSLEDPLLNLFFNKINQPFEVYFKQHLQACSNNTLKHILHLCLLSSKPYIHKDRVNNFPLFDNDKPNNHIDHPRE